jgi:phytoene dehydrogenase-like protein
MTAPVDAVVIGAGPNGLVAANDLAEHGWDVLVLEAEPDPGGAVRSAETLEPGFVTDRFSAFYPLAAVSPHLARLELERDGLHWMHSPAVLGNPTVDGPSMILHRDREATAASLDEFAKGDGDAWLRLQDEWEAIEPDLIRALMLPFPPVGPAVKLAASLGVRGAGEFARRALLPVRRFVDEQFEGEGGGLLIAGSALHADLTPEASIGGLLGWMLGAIGQAHGWPVPRGGAGALTDALVRRLDRHGGRLRCNSRVIRIEVGSDRVTAVHTEDGDRIEVTRAVVADVVAPTLYERLVDRHAVPDRILEDLWRYQRGAATFKVNWTLDGRVPWDDPALADAGTVHVASSLDELTMNAAQLSNSQIPDEPFVLVGQMTAADASRSPAGTSSVWAYTSVPQTSRGDAAGELEGLEDPSDAERFADRMERRIERFAPGFRSHIRRREIQTPLSMERDDANLLGGDKSLGTAQLHQQLVFRPTLGLARTATPISGLFLASASAHPGGGVHGACGANAARAAIAADRRRRLFSFPRRLARPLAAARRAPRPPAPAAGRRPRPGSGR